VCRIFSPPGTSPTPVCPALSRRITRFLVKNGPCAPLTLSSMLSRPATGMTAISETTGVVWVTANLHYVPRYTTSMPRAALLVPLSLLLIAQQPSAPRLTADLVRDLQVRNLMGTFSSGRIADVAVDPRNRSVWYVATASGGLWKTINHGVTFEPIFDKGGAYSLGCVTVDPRNPDVVWLGTGENNAQRAIGYGDGVYKSTDAGRTWKKAGLPNSEHVAKIVIDPRNSNTVFVAAQGPLFGPGGDRGVFKT